MSSAEPISWLVNSDFSAAVYRNSSRCIIIYFNYPSISASDESFPPRFANLYYQYAIICIHLFINVYIYVCMSSAD